MDALTYSFANWLLGNEWRRAIFITACILIGGAMQGECRAMSRAADTSLRECRVVMMMSAGIPKALDDADARIAALPSPEEAKFKEFMTALGGVIDLGKSNGIEVEFLNPLRATMKKLSENALTFQPSASLSASQKEQAL